MRSDELGHAARVCVTTLQPAADRDWECPAADLDWTCRRTLDHIIDALLFYAVHFASRATERQQAVRNGDPAATVTGLLAELEGATEILARLCEEAPEDTRAFHPAGMADVSGFIAMGCDEILVHTGDIAAGMGISFLPPEDLCAAILARLFPWAPEGFDAWQTLRWANGRAPLGEHPQLDENWYWWCEPLDTWDGQRKVRTAPPAWR